MRAAKGPTFWIRTGKSASQRSDEIQERLRCGHGLLLHGVHPAEPSDALLIKLYGLAMLGGGTRSLAQGVKFLPQSRKEPGSKLTQCQLAHALSASAQREPCRTGSSPWWWIR